MGTSHEEGWHSATNPRHILRLSRVRPNGRKYLLLACATVRHLVPGPRTELGVRILDALERFAVAQPAKGVATHLWRDVVRVHVPEIPEPLPFTWSFGTDTAWARQFTYRLKALSQIHTSEVNVVFDLAFEPVRSVAAREAYQEAQALAAQLMLGAPAAPVGWFRRLLSRVASSTPKMLLDANRFREEVIGRLPAEKRDRVRAEWPGTAGSSAWQRGLQYLTTEREERASAELNLRACELVREVFGNPFRPPVIEPAWLVWNHGAVRHIAERIATSGDFGDVPILGDALEDAGCGDTELLSHCRAPHAHVPGCWAVDAVLGRN